MKTPTAADVMQSDVLTVNADSSVAETARMMLCHKISGVPVLDSQRRLVGIVTEGDLLRRSEIGTERHRARWLDLLRSGRAAEDYMLAHGRKVSEVMSDQVVAASPDTALGDVVSLMEENNIKRVPVLDGDKLLGIVSRADILRALVDASAPVAMRPTTDAQIREQIQNGIDQAEWSSRASIKVDVAGGVVSLDGCITDERERAALTVLAENVPGVNKVVDHLIWIEPLSGMVIDPHAGESPADAPQTK
jgi:CBS domain-containing protein